MTNSAEEFKISGGRNHGGRTTAMLKAALEFAIAGKTVYIVGKDTDHQLYLEYQTRKLYDRDDFYKLRIQFKSLHIDRLTTGNIDPYVVMLCLKGNQSEYAVFTDHYAIEYLVSRLHSQQSA